MAEYSDILKEIKRVTKEFEKGVPASQRAAYDAVIEEVNRLDLDPAGNIKSTVKNLSILASIKGKITRVILTDDYKAQVKDLVKGLNTITTLSNDYWKGLETSFKPRPLLKQIRQQSINDTVAGLTEAGISANVAQPITNILNTNITTGASYKQLAESIRAQLIPVEGAGSLEKYATTYAITSVNTSAAQYNNKVASDLGYEWYRYDNSEIQTSRGFCQHMCEPGNRWFHISEIPRMLQARARDGGPMKYNDFETGEEKTVTLNATTGLPDGFMKGTNVSNFLDVRGGWNCGHQCRPTNKRQIPADVIAAVEATPAYKAWRAANDPVKEGPAAPPPPKPAPKPAAPVATGKPAPVGTTVSSQMGKTSPVLKKTVSATMAAIDEVHGLGSDTLKAIPIQVDTRGTGSYGAFWHSPGAGGLRVPSKITILPDGAYPEMTTAHEMGHYLDVFVMGKKGKFASLSDPDTQALIKVMHDTDSMRTIQKAIDTGKIKKYGSLWPATTSEKDYLLYMARPKEMFARAYAQFIATRSSNQKMKTQLAETIEKDKETNFPQQWSKSDFQKIEAAMEELFIKRGFIAK